MPKTPMPLPLAVVKVLNTRGRVAAVVCPLCVLIVAAGHDRHDAVHRAQFAQTKEEQ